MKSIEPFCNLPARSAAVLRLSVATTKTWVPSAMSMLVILLDWFATFWHHQFGRDWFAARPVLPYNPARVYVRSHARRGSPDCLSRNHHGRVQGGRIWSARYREKLAARDG